MYDSGIEFAFSLDILIVFWNFSECVAFFVFLDLIFKYIRIWQQTDSLLKGCILQ